MKKINTPKHNDTCMFMLDKNNKGITNNRVSRVDGSQLIV